jgi:hypothetical protein
MNIVLIETSGNQRYIFATNKLRENVGASELTYRVGTQIVLEAVATETKQIIYEDDDLDGRKMRANLLDPSLNPPIENSNRVEVITATSGKALLLVNDRPTGEKIVRAVTKRALREMPGLTVHGAISKDFTDLKEVHQAIGEVHRRLEEIRYQMPGNEQRFLRLPFVTPCASSGLPASEIIEFKNNQGMDVYAFSNVTTAKRRALGKARKKFVDDSEASKGRIIKLLEETFALTLPKNLEEFEKAFPKSDWLAVIHADGNGLGEIFLKFNEYSKSKGREYIEIYRKFSLALDVCTINAVGFALKSLQNLFMKEAVEEIPIVPIILGGDDLTVLCSGRYALKFTHDFLSQFEKETEKISEEMIVEGVTIKLDYLKNIVGELQGVIPTIANNAFGNKGEKNPSVKRLGICAGVAVIKPNYPFHQAYDLAEQLLQSAKEVKTKVVQTDERQIPCSALDYHILYDSAHSDLEDIRERLIVDSDKTKLFAKPYVITNEKELSNTVEKTWFENRKFSELEKRVSAMNAKDEDSKRKLPNSQLHSLREALFLGKNETNARVNLIAHRYEDEETGTQFSELLVKDTRSLFFRETKTNGEVHSTHFMDALDVVEFWKGFDVQKQSGKGNGKNE